MLEEHSPDDHEVKEDGYVCAYHRQHPEDRNYAGCGCSHSYSLVKKKEISMLDKLKALKKRNREINFTFSKLSRESTELDEEYNRLLVQCMKEEGLLKNCVWELSIRKGLCNLYSSDPIEEKISKLMLRWQGYHYGIKLLEGVNYHANDGESGIHFDKNELFLPFVEEWEIKVDCSEVEKEINKLRKDLIDLENIYNLTRK